MFDALVVLLTSPSLLASLGVATLVGLIYGIIPGLGGKVAIVSAMPFVFGMDVLTGCVFLISLHAVVHTGGAAPSILFGIPGTGPSTAAIIDGHAMARRGEAARALSASMTASAVGGVLGALFLALLIPVALPLMKLLSYAEVFILCIFGIALAATLGGDAPVKGLITGCFGLCLSFVGTDPIYGVNRFTLDQLFLWDGLDLITAVLAIFAIPEMIDTVRTGQRSMQAATDAPVRYSAQIVQGMRDVLVHRWLTLRSSALGAVIGFIPGLGGDVAAWLCYGQAVQSSQTPERFGKGAVEGVIGPEAANNSKEGGALAPTLFLGVPGSSGMAIMLVALAPLGVSPGPNLAIQRPDLLWLMVWALVLSNLVGAAIMIALIPRLGLLEKIEARVLAPFVFLLCLLSIDLSTHEWRFFGVAAALALVGYAFKRLGWPRAPFVIGIVLGPVTEQALIKSVGIWGPTFFLRPASLLMIGLLLIALVGVGRRLARSAAVSAARAS